MASIKYTASSGIYIILNTKSGNIYIGQAQGLTKRWGQHKGLLIQSKHPNRHLQNAWNKYGAKVFKFQVLERCPIDQLDEREQHYLDIYMPKGICYNIAKEPGTTRGLHQSDSAKQKIRLFMTGRKLSDETKSKQRLAKLGIKRSKETRQKMSAAMLAKNRNKLTKLQSEVTDPMWWLEKYKRGQNLK